MFKNVPHVLNKIRLHVKYLLNVNSLEIIWSSSLLLILIKNATKNAVKAVISLYMECLENPEVLHCATLSLQHHYDVGKRYHITMSPQSQNVIGLYRDVNLTKNQCRYNIGWPLGVVWRFTLFCPLREDIYQRSTSGNPACSEPTAILKQSNTAYHSTRR